MPHSECRADGIGPFQGLCELIDDHVPKEVVGPLVSRMLWGLIVLLIVLGVGRAVRLLTRRALDRARADPQLRTLVNNVLMATTVAVGLFAAVTAAGVSATFLITFGGVAGLAVGLAFQDLLRNVLAGIFLLVERPFRIGDVIVVGDLTGSVQTIELRTTTLRTTDGRLAIMPNLNAFNETVINVTAFDVRQFTVSLWVPAGRDLERVMTAARRVLETAPEVARHPAPRAQPSVDLDGGVTLNCQYWLPYRDHDADAVAATMVRRLYAAAEGERQDAASPGRAAASPASRSAKGGRATGAREE